MDWTVFLTDTWFKWLIANYSILIFTVIPWVILFLLQAIAIMWPGAKANQIRELFQAMWPAKSEPPKVEPVEPK